jgi:WD40 repeat protein
MRLTSLGYGVGVVILAASAFIYARASSFSIHRVPSTTPIETSPEESVRTGLIRLQEGTGLSLASFYKRVDVVKFSDRSLIQGKEPFITGGAALQGEISRDGDEIAFGVFGFQRRGSLAIVRHDDSGTQEFPNLTALGICWSYDKSHLAISVQVPAMQYEPIHTNLILLNVATKEVQQVSDGGNVTSQCWSPDGKRIVYEANDSINVYDVDKKGARVLARGKFPTWSSDGQWLAFLDNDTYYAITPSGEGRKVLFKKKKAMSGLWWSPNSKIVAFLSQNSTFEGPLTLDIELVRLRVRRLADGSEDWVAQDSAAYLPSYQWVTSPQLIQEVESGATSR